MPVLFVYYVYDNPTYEVANKLICILYLLYHAYERIDNYNERVHRTEHLATRINTIP